VDWWIGVLCGGLTSGAGGGARAVVGDAEGLGRVGEGMSCWVREVMRARG